MAKSKKRRTRDTFVFPAELGARLRELRKRAGLTQKELAELMGRRGATARPRIARLELGSIKYPTIAFIADYLRACRAGFDDLGDILKRYTSQPRVIEQKGTRAVQRLIKNLPAKAGEGVLFYDAKTTIYKRFAGEKPLLPKERLLRTRKMGATAIQQEKLRAWLAEVVNNLDIVPTLSVRKFAADYGSKVWAILNQTRKKKPESRLGMLHEARKWAEEQNTVPESVVKHIQDMVLGLFKLMEKSGELDYLPSATEIKARRARKKRQATARRRPDIRIAAVDPAGARQGKVFGVIQMEVNRELEANGMPQDKRLKYLRREAGLFRIALATEPGSDQRKQQVEELVAKTSRPAEAGKVAEVFLRQFERCKYLLAPEHK